MASLSSTGEWSPSTSHAFPHRVLCSRPSGQLIRCIFVLIQRVRCSTSPSRSGVGSGMKIPIRRVGEISQICVWKYSDLYYLVHRWRPITKCVQFNDEVPSALCLQSCLGRRDWVCHCPHCVHYK